MARLRDVDSGDVFTTTASTIVNAAGPFVDELNREWGLSSEHRIVYSKGIHLVVPRLTTTDHHKVLAFFDDTQRLFYVIPMGRRSVIGTTDTRVDSPFTETTEDDIEFLLEQINARMDLDQPLSRGDVIADRCGVRPLVVKVGAGDQSEVDWTKLSRKHAIEVDPAQRVVTIFGGKLTDCLNVGEEVAEQIEGLGIPLEEDLHNWFGEPAAATRAEFVRQARLMRLDGFRTKADTEPLTDRLWRRYGRRAFAMLDAIREDPAMAEDVMGSADYLPRGTAHGGPVRDGHQARGLHAAPLEDRSRGSPRRHRVVDRPPRGGRDPVRSRRRPPSRRVLRRRRPCAGSRATAVRGHRGVMFARLRRRWSAPEPIFDDAWDPLLDREFEHWNTLSPDELDRMRMLVARFVSDTRWEAANGFTLTEEIQVLIAAQASMLLLGLDLDSFPLMSSVIVHPSTVVQRGDRATGGGLHSSGPQMLAGQAHYRGPVLLSWSATRRGAKFPQRGENVVYHEFAHQLDMIDGVTDGTPPLDDEAARERWVRVCTAAYDSVRADRSEVLRPYAGTNPAEFFAVATEVFFNRPDALRTHEPELYAELAAFYRQDPAGRLTP